MLSNIFPLQKKKKKEKEKEPGLLGELADSKAGVRSRQDESEIWKHRIKKQPPHMMGPYKKGYISKLNDFPMIQDETMWAIQEKENSTGL